MKKFKNLISALLIGNLILANTTIVNASTRDSDFYNHMTPVPGSIIVDNLRSDGMQAVLSVIDGKAVYTREKSDNTSVYLKITSSTNQSNIFGSKNNISVSIWGISDLAKNSFEKYSMESNHKSAFNLIGIRNCTYRTNSFVIGTSPATYLLYNNVKEYGYRNAALCMATSYNQVSGMWSPDSVTPKERYQIIK